MALSNPRLLIDGIQTFSYAQGRKGLLAVDLDSFPGGGIQFELRKYRGADIWELVWVRKETLPATTGAYSTTVPISLNWRCWYGPLAGSTEYDLLRQSWQAGQEIGYDYDSFLLGGTDDDRLYAKLKVEVTAPGIPGFSPVSAQMQPKRSHFYPGNKVDLLIDGNEALPSLLAAINAAQHHIHIDVFFFSPDEIGKKVVVALKARALAGIKVRILFDSLLTSVPPPAGPGAGFAAVDRMIDELRAAGVSVGRAEDPIGTDEIRDPEYKDRANTAVLYTSADISKFMFTSGYPFTTRPHGVTDHSKLIIIDGIIGFTGGMNIANAYMYELPFDPSKTSEQEVKDRTTAGQPEAFVKWHDTFVRIQGPVVVDMQQYFVERWAQTTGEILSRSDPAYFPGPATFGPANVKFMVNAPGSERSVTIEYLRMFGDAQTKLLVHNPYVTDDLLMLYLCDAAKNRNVATTLIVPDEHHDIKVPYITSGVSLLQTTQ